MTEFGHLAAGGGTTRYIVAARLAPAGHRTGRDRSGRSRCREPAPDRQHWYA
jgi:hypothetical protein